MASFLDELNQPTRIDKLFDKNLYWLAIFQLKDFTFPSLSDDPQSMEFSWFFGWYLDDWAADFFWQQCDFIDTLNPTMYHTVLLSVVKMKMNVLKNAPIPKSLVILDNFLDDFLGDC